MRRVILTLATAALALVAFAATAQARPGQHDRGPSYEHTLETAVMVQWGGSWWDAEILDVRGDLTLITYTGWSSSWDEWVGPERIRTRPTARVPATRVPTTFVPPAAPAPTVQILWGGSWYAGRVLDQRGGRYLVTYDGYSASWDEWVGPERLRFLQAPPTRRPPPRVPPRHAVRR